MNFNDYQESAEETAVYPVNKELEYLCLGLCGEAGEVANKVKKVLRGDVTLTVEVRQGIADELGDVLWYLSMLTGAIQYDLDKVAKANLFKLYKRKAESKLKGSGDKR